MLDGDRAPTLGIVDERAGLLGDVLHRPARRSLHMRLGQTIDTNRIRIDDVGERKDGERTIHQESENVGVSSHTSHCHLHLNHTDILRQDRIKGKQKGRTIALDGRRPTLVLIRNRRTLGNSIDCVRQRRHETKSDRPRRGRSTTT